MERNGHAPPLVQPQPCCGSYESIGLRVKPLLGNWSSSILSRLSPYRPRPSKITGIYIGTIGVKHNTDSLAAPSADGLTEGLKDDLCAHVVRQGIAKNPSGAPVAHRTPVSRTLADLHAGDIACEESTEATLI